MTKTMIMAGPHNLSKLLMIYRVCRDPDDMIYSLHHARVPLFGVV